MTMMMMMIIYTTHTERKETNKKLYTQRKTKQCQPQNVQVNPPSILINAGD